MYSKKRGWSYSSTAPLTPVSSAYRRRRWRVRLPRLPRVGPLPFAILLVGGVAWYHFFFNGFSVNGTVVDGASGRPVAAARVWSAAANTITNVDGTFVLGSVKPPEMISTDAPGYRGLTLRLVSPFEPLQPRLEPVSVEIATVDADSGQPIAATLAAPANAQLLGTGRVRVTPARAGERFQLSADGYQAIETTFTDQDVLRVAMQPKLNGRVTDAITGKGVAGARIDLGGVTLTSDAAGGYEVKRRPTDGQLQVLVPGYRRARIDLSQRPGLDVQLQPNEVRATYMTYFAIGGSEYRQDMYQLLDTTEVNAVVIDVKGDYGLLSYHSSVPLAEQIGANQEPTIDDLDGLLQTLHQHNAYAIARIVIFKDNILARNGGKAGLDLGVKDRRTGDLWVDGEKLAWVDPFSEVAWDYNTALAREAIQRGFDEVQFDYVRFATDPSPDGSIDDIVYSKPLTAENRVAALKGFLTRAHRAVSDAGGFLGMDTFGYTTWWTDDGGIGQDLEVLADSIDYYCPMVYPSTFSAGLPGTIPYPDVVSRPYEVIFESLKHVEEKLAGKHVMVRPWLQYFDDYPWATRMRYDAPQIEAQKKAVTDAKAYGWMMWNAGSLFKRGGLSPKQ